MSAENTISFARAAPIFEDEPRCPAEQCRGGDLRFDLADAGVFANEGDVMQLHQFTSTTKTESAHRDDRRNRQALDLLSDGEGLRERPPSEIRVFTNKVAAHVSAATEMTTLGQSKKRP